VRQGEQCRCGYGKDDGIALQIAEADFRVVELDAQLVVLGGYYQMGYVVFRTFSFHTTDVRLGENDLGGHIAFDLLEVVDVVLLGHLGSTGFQFFITIDADGAACRSNEKNKAQ